MEPVETYAYQGMTISIHYDHDAGNPREEWSNLGTLIFHERNGWYRRDDYSDKNAPCLEFIPELIDIPGLVYRSIHSNHGGYVYSRDEPYDEGNHEGIIYIGRDTWRKEYGWKRLTKARRAILQSCLDGEIETYRDYRTGNVYGYVIESEAGDHLDSCWGFIGDSAYCKEQAQASADYYANQRDQRRDQRTELTRITQSFWQLSA